MHGLILAELGNDWSLAASIETFAIPIGLFLVIAASLFFLLTRPHMVPGHRDLTPAAAGAGPAGGSTGAAGKHAAAPDAGNGS